MNLKSLLRIGLILAIMIIPATVSAESCPSARDFSGLTTFPEITNLTEYRMQWVVPASELETSCDQHQFLHDLFMDVTANATTEVEKVEMWVTYLQATTYPSCYPPLDDNNAQLVFSPTWLIRHHGMQCGQNARLAVDGFHAGGMQARVIQLNQHVAAEVYANGKWRFIDPDMLDTGVFVRMPGGDIASIPEIEENRSLTTGIIAYRERDSLPSCGNNVTPFTNYTSVFDRYLYPGSQFPTPYGIGKTATPEQETNYYYGWNYYAYEPLVYLSDQQPSPERNFPTVSQIRDTLETWSLSSQRYKG
jgi:hypothetical protein